MSVKCINDGSPSHAQHCTSLEPNKRTVVERMPEGVGFNVQTQDS